MPTPEDKSDEALLLQIERQQAISDEALQVVTQALQEVYYQGQTPAQIASGHIGSFTRGTNNGSTPDVDMMLLSVPNDSARGFSDWTDKGTDQLTDNKSGLVELDEVQKHDAQLRRAIEITKQQLEAHYKLPAGATQFNYVRSWQSFPGVVFNVTVPASEFEQINLDVNLYHPAHFFGVEHGRRFRQYLDRVKAEHGNGRAAQLIRDIRRLKQAVKDHARDASGSIDKHKKVSGFVIEALFTHQAPPPDFAQVTAKLIDHHWTPGHAPQHESIQDHQTQLIDNNMTFESLLECLSQSGAITTGGWAALLAVSQAAGG